MYSTDSPATGGSAGRRPNLSDPGSPSELEVPGSLRSRAARGFFWMMAQTIGIKAVNLFGQLVLAWLLLPADFGLLALANTLGSMASLIQQAGLREILIQRHLRF